MKKISNTEPVMMKWNDASLKDPKLHDGVHHRYPRSKDLLVWVEGVGVREAFFYKYPKDKKGNFLISGLTGAWKVTHWAYIRNPKTGKQVVTKW